MEDGDAPETYFSNCCLIVFWCNFELRSDIYQTLLLTSHVHSPSIHFQGMIVNFGVLRHSEVDEFHHFARSCPTSVGKCGQNAELMNLWI